MKKMSKLYFLLVIPLILAIVIGISKSDIIQTDDQKFITQNENLIKDIVWQKYDYNKEKIKTITIVSQTVKGEFDNGGDVSGDYDITFQAIVNDSQDKIINIDINFPDAKIGPFTFIKPNPYKQKMSMTIDKEHFQTTFDDKGAKERMDSWWNFIPEVWAENFSLDSFDKDSSAHETIEEVYLTHRNSILEYLSKINDVSTSQIIEDEIKTLNVTHNSENQFEMRLTYLDIQDDTKTYTLTLFLNKQNLLDSSLSIYGQLNGQKSTEEFRSIAEGDIKKKMQQIETEIENFHHKKAIAEDLLDNKNQQTEVKIAEKYQEKCREFVFNKITSGDDAMDKETTDLIYNGVEYQDIYNFSFFYKISFKPNGYIFDGDYIVEVRLTDNNLKNPILPIEAALVIKIRDQTIPTDFERISLD